MYWFARSIKYYILYHVQLADLVDSLPKKLLVLVTHHHHDHIEGMVRNVLVSISLVLLYRACGIIKSRWWNIYHVIVFVVLITARPAVHPVHEKKVNPFWFEIVGLSVVQICNPDAVLLTHQNTMNRIGKGDKLNLFISFCYYCKTYLHRGGNVFIFPFLKF